MMTMIIETPRLILRTWKDSDLEPMAAIDQDPKVCEFLPGQGSLEGTRGGIAYIKQHFETHGFSVYAVELKSTGEMIGFVGLSVPSFEAHFTPCVEIAWRLASHHWNQGYATEAAKAVLQYAFTKLNLNEVVSFTVANNYASRRIMEKIGMHREAAGDFDHPRIEKESPLCRHVLYRISKEDFIKQNSQILL